MERSNWLSQRLIVLSIATLMSGFILAAVIWMVQDKPASTLGQPASNATSSATDSSGDNTDEFSEAEKMAAAIRADGQRQTLSSEDLEKMKTMTYAKEGGLSDVTAGREILGISTGGSAGGTVQSNFGEGGYHLRVVMSGLPGPIGDAYYEGWLVRLDPLEAISTGKVGKIDGAYTDVYRSLEDLSGFAKYVLTLEPNASDPAPADHMLESVMGVKGE